MMMVTIFIGTVDKEHKEKRTRGNYQIMTVVESRAFHSENVYERLSLHTQIYTLIYIFSSF